MLARRLLIALPAVAALGAAAGAQTGGGFIGQWQGEVEGVGDATIVITAVRPGGQVEGRMEFKLHSFVSPFGDKADSGAARISHGVVSGTALTIEAALGGRYDLALEGNRLTGSYTRGTTFKGKAAFTRA